MDMFILTMTTTKKGNNMYKSIKEIVEKNKKINGHFFDKMTMGFFNSGVVNQKPVKGKYFFTTEAVREYCRKRYTVRRANPDGTIDTIGPFYKWDTLEDAKLFLKNHMYEVEEMEI